MKKALFLLLSAVIVLSLVSCGQTTYAELTSSASPSPTPSIVPSIVIASPRSPSVTQTAQKLTPPPRTSVAQLPFVEGITAFACDLYQWLKGNDGNIFFSPYSISTLMAMGYAGARGETEKQIANVFYFSLPQDQLHPAFKALNDAINRRSNATATPAVSPVASTDPKAFKLSTVNVVWGQEGYKFSPEYLDTLNKNYGGGLKSIDFANKSEESRVTINDWISNQTNDKIKDLLAPGMVNPATRMVLTNAIYFKANWLVPFDEFSRDRPFYLLDGTEISVPTMHKKEFFNYAENDSYQAAELPYYGGELSMVVLVPKDGHFNEFENSLNEQGLSDIVKSFTSKEIRVLMPKFKFDSSFSLGKTLSDMGMPIAFTGAADFSGMTGQRDFSMSFVVHKSFVAVDEIGTEAAAASAAGYNTASSDPIPFTVNRPFIFFIRDIKTGTILFLGRVLNPAT